MGSDADVLSVPRGLQRIVRRHPRQLPERLVLLALERLAEPTRGWAAAVRARAAGDERQLSARCAMLVRETTAVARVDGAVAGTPFFIALVPAYIAFLWAQARMVLQIAALRGRDPGDPALAAELLALRGVYPSKEEAADALARLDEQPLAADGRRARLERWALLVRRILVLAAFASPASPEQPRRLRLRQVVVAAIGVLIWIGTWIFPITFMIVLGWSCDRSTRQLGALALDYYAVASDEGPRTRLERLRGRLARVRSPRRLAWALGLGLSVALPLTVIALSVSNRASPAGWVRALAPLAGLAVVLALARGLAQRV
jgi:hypothetical protein